MKTLTLIVALLFVVGCLTFAWAQQPTTPTAPTKAEPPHKKAPAEKPMMLSGEIETVDATANSITLKDKAGKTESLKLDSKVVVKKAGKSIALNDLTAGEKVTVTYKKAEAGEKIVTRITVKVPLVKKEPTKKEESVPVKEKTAPAPK
jgi:hypothetical protein